MQYQCDICSTYLQSKSLGKFYNQQRVLTSPSYWEKIAKRPDSFGDAAFGMFLSNLCNDTSGFTVCQNCSKMLDGDIEKSKEYGLERFLSLNPSTTVDKTPAIIVAATVWEKVRGKWPTSVDVQFAKLRIKGEQKPTSSSEKTASYLTTNLVFVWSCPTAPNMNSMIGIVTKVCPEYSEISNPAGNVALSWDDGDTDEWQKKNDIRKIAVDTFGNKILDETKYVLEVKKVSSKELGNFNGEGIYLVVKQKKNEQKKVKPRAEQQKTSQEKIELK